MRDEDILSGERGGYEVSGRHARLDVVQTWMGLLALFAGSTRPESRDDRDDQIYELLSAAKLFQIEWDDYEALNEDVQYYLWSTGMSCPDYLSRAWTTHHRMPFDVVFMGIRRPEVLFRGRDGKEPDESDRPVALGGWICTPSTMIQFDVKMPPDRGVEVVQIRRDPSSGSISIWDPSTGVFDPGEQANAAAIPFSIPRILFGLMELEADVVRETGVNPFKRAKIRKSFPEGPDAPPFPIPRRYRQIFIRGNVRFVSARRKAVVACGPAWKLVHRIDVRGHWWIRVRRGWGEVPKESVEKLDPKYVWVDDTTAPIDDDTLALLHRRAVPPRRSGEWMGVLKRWVEEHQRGPEDGPYVPAVWRYELDEPQIGSS